MPSYKHGSGVEPIWYATAKQRGAFKVTEDHVLNNPSAGSRGVVVAYVSDQQAHASEHERITQAEFARRLAALKDYEAGGLYDPRRHYPGHMYFVPGITLTGSQAATLGIRGPDDLFGGVVPHSFVATKVISHPLISPTPPRWPAGIQPSPHWSAIPFWPAMPLSIMTMRAEPVICCSKAGPCASSQSSPAADTLSRWHATPPSCSTVLEAIDPREVVSHGLVLEENMSEVRTFSVGQVQVADLTASYFGLQRLTRNNRGAEVFGGSELTVVRGDFDAFLALHASPEIRCAIEQAQRYNAAAITCFSGFFASRNNYDIVLGRDAAGRSRSGVLEQSWRLGGATGAELAALEVFRNQPGRNLVRASASRSSGEPAAAAACDCLFPRQ